MKSNRTTSISIRKKDDNDYMELRQLLSEEGISQGEYLVNAYRELDQGSINHYRLRALRCQR